MATEGRRSKRITPATVLSGVALFVALSGAAVALPGQNTVNSGDIIDQSVKARDLKTASVKADEISDGIQPRSNSVVVNGGINENGAYTVEQVTASCQPGEELISGSGHWTNNANEELFLQEVVLNHATEQVTVRGGNDTDNNRTLHAVAHCIQA
jgi:dissimilatory sulfite reductase (desulfoviridin) alpha/beta subunit